MKQGFKTLAGLTGAGGWSKVFKKLARIYSALGLEAQALLALVHITIAVRQREMIHLEYRS